MSWAIWITGLPGSGKSVLAREVARVLAQRGEPATVLELDALRKILTPAPTYSAAERNVVYRALVHMASQLTDAGVPVIIDATAHRRAWRDLARATIPHFAEIQLTCPLEIARQREHHRPAGNAPRDIYAAAGRPGATVPGVDVPYEPALDPELTVDTSAVAPEEAAARMVDVALDLARVAPPRRRPDARPAWALWITGLPGSGKTTLASAVAGALAARGIEAHLIEIDPLRELLLTESPGDDAGEEIIHRALVCAAKLLADAGVPVIIDATASRRRWRQLARDLIAHYAEIQLLCPPEVCGARERAVRWNPVRCAHGGRPAAIRRPDIVIDYEASLNPELSVHTDVRDLWSVTEEIVVLAHRLHHRTGERPCTSAI